MDWNGIKEWVIAEGTGHWFFIAFPIILLTLLIWFKGRRVRFLIPSLLVTIVIVNPVFYKYWTNLGLYAYWRILWIIPVIPVLGAVIPSLTERIRKNLLKGIAVAVGSGAVIIAGSFLYSGPGGSFVKAANAAKLPKNVVEIADRLLELDESPRVVLQHPLGVYMRQYSGEIEQLYGRDLDGYILGAKADARNVYNALSENNMSAVATTMANDQYEYLIVNAGREEVLSEPEYEAIDKTEDYEIYRLHGKPTVVKARNELGQVVKVTTVNEKGQPVNNEFGYATIEWQYDSNGNITREFRSDTTGSGVADSNSQAGYEREYDSRGNIIIERFLRADDGLVVTGAGYAEVHRIYDGRHLIREEYYGSDRKPMVQAAGHVAIRQTWDGDILESREYLNAFGELINRKDGYAKAIWEKEDNHTSIKFFTAEGIEVPITGLNLVKDVKGNLDGWSDWIIPSYNAVNSTQNIGTVNLGSKIEGDLYICTMEIEFRDVHATEGQALRFWTQGAQDGRWDIGSIWDGTLINLHKAPEDGIYKYTTMVAVSEQMVDISTFDIGFRCDYWASGMYRVRNVRIEKGDKCNKWQPGV